MKNLHNIFGRMKVSLAGFGAVVATILALVLILYLLPLIIRLFYIGA